MTTRKRVTHREYGKLFDDYRHYRTLAESTVSAAKEAAEMAAQSAEGNRRLLEQNKLLQIALDANKTVIKVLEEELKSEKRRAAKALDVAEASSGAAQQIGFVTNKLYRTLEEMDARYKLQDAEQEKKQEESRRLLELMVEDIKDIKDIKEFHGH